MVSKREKKRWRKFMEQQGFILDLHLAKLMYDELRFERRMRNKAIRLSRKRKVGDYVK